MTDFDFQDKDQINRLLRTADDHNETKRLISKFDALKKVRQPFYLEEGDFEEILRWKLRSQYGMQQAKRRKNTPGIIETVTMAAFSITHDEKDVEAFFKLRMLRTLVGVETAVASAILTLCFPTQFGVIDFRIWRQLFGERKSYFTSSDYLKYIALARDLAFRYGYTVQQIDQAIWQLDIETNG